MGAHPKAPSQVRVGGRWLSLAELIEHDPEAMLGRRTAGAFQNRLPYLFKVLAAARPLSLQAHPNLEQARQGFERENRAGLAIDDPRRNYRDANHKPECIFALTPFWALHGFRAIPRFLELVERLAVTELTDLARTLRSRPDGHGLRDFFQQLLSGSAERNRALSNRIAAGAAARAPAGPEFDWVIRLGEAYPGDIGIIAPLLLNLVQLQPGEAVFLPAGELHAYLQGTGIELMANSDNVLRGGLTPKHVDVPELMRVLNFREKAVLKIEPRRTAPAERRFECPAKEFVLSEIRVDAATPYESAEDRSLEILLCIRGNGRITDRGNGDGVDFRQGVSLIVPAAVQRYALQGKARVFKASVPQHSKRPKW
jgi:mannose-6-phosphate isomerase